jgi:type IV pilus assembly protein PilY1
MQNFANWFTYYRKRKLMLAGSMGRVMEDISGLRLGVVPFNENAHAHHVRCRRRGSGHEQPLRRAGQFYLNAMSANGHADAPERR